jgi:hypothetical protein
MFGPFINESETRTALLVQFPLLLCPRAGRPLEITMNRISAVFVLWLAAVWACAADQPLKVFILAGQSNMVGWGDSLKLPENLRTLNDKVLMFEGGKRPLKPFKKAQENQGKFGMTEFSFGPEIAFAHDHPARHRNPSDERSLQHYGLVLFERTANE